MGLHDFIFSNQLRHRLPRHLLFWICCWLYFLFTIYVPFGVLPDWSSGHLANAIKLNGGLYNWMERRAIHSLICISSFIMVAYFINYFLLPGYFFKRRFWKGSLLFSLSIVFLIIAQGIAGYFIRMQNYLLNPTKRIKPDFLKDLTGSPKTILLAGPIVIGVFVAIKMGKRIWQKQRETELIAKEKARAELSLLKSQIHPHFLFNTLNNIYYFLLSASQQAPVMIRKLSGMLQYIIQECDRSYMPLEGEIKMIQDYISLEKIRYGNQMGIDIKIEGDPQNKLIAPLLMIPLVENSFKHGVSKMINNQAVKVEIKISDDFLFFSIVNNKPAQVEDNGINGHVGLKNVKHRLQLLYPGKHELNIASKSEIFSVWMKVRLFDNRLPEMGEAKSTAAYAME